MSIVLSGGFGCARSRGPLRGLTALIADAFEENACGLLVWVLRHESAGEGFSEDGLAERTLLGTDINNSTLEFPLASACVDGYKLSPCDPMLYRSLSATHRPRVASVLAFSIPKTRAPRCLAIKAVAPRMKPSNTSGALGGSGTTPLIVYTVPETEEN